VGAETLKRFQAQAQLQLKPCARPYLLEEVKLPSLGLELFFDVETDPMRDICYLHGFVERTNGDTTAEKYVPFFAQQPTQQAEREAFAEAWQYIRNKNPSAVYFCSKYERTVWRELSRRHTDVATEVDVDKLFASKAAVDLYNDIVRPKTEWPTRNLSIKTLASFLGFEWRDKDPSGASSIEWYHRWVETGDLEIKQRILDYNEDDCRATRILADALRDMAVQR